MKSDENELLRSVALQNATSILATRRRVASMLVAFCRATDRSNSFSSLFIVTHHLRDVSPPVSYPAPALGSWQRQFRGSWKCHRRMERIRNRPLYRGVRRECTQRLRVPCRVLLPQSQ